MFYKKAPLCGGFTPYGNCCERVEAIVKLQRHEIKCVKVKQIVSDNALLNQEQDTQMGDQSKIVNCKILSRATNVRAKLGVVCIGHYYEKL